MCMEPVSAGLAVVGAAASIYGSVSAGNAEGKAARSNAQLLSNMANEREKKAAFDADTRLKKAAFDIETAKRNAGRKSGTVRAGISASGFSQASFSDVLADDASEAALEQAAIKYTADLDAYEARYQGAQEARQLRSQAAGQINAASDAERAGWIRGAAGAATSLGGAFTGKTAQATTSGWEASVSNG